MINQIKSDKILMKDVFTRWFQIPQYQRPYKWDKEQISDLLEDITDAFQSRPGSEYFLGSIVFQTKEVKDGAGSVYEEDDLLDGQQRLTTCLILIAVARDLSKDPNLKQMCQGAIYQKQNPYNGTPERSRIVYAIRAEPRSFVDTYLKPENGTSAPDKVAQLKDLKEKAPDISVCQMAKAVLQVREYFGAADAPNLEGFFTFFFNKVLLVYVASGTLDDAFRLFTVLNDRGMKLTTSDILKARNLRALVDQNIPESERAQWTTFWEDTESELDENFDTFLGHLRTIIVKEKARLGLLQEFEDTIYKGGLLKEGKPTFDFIKSYKDQYDAILDDGVQLSPGDYQFQNLVSLMHMTGANIWLPPLLHYRRLYGDNQITEFARKLENKYSADWILGATPTVRSENMNRILKQIDIIHGNVNLTQAQQIGDILKSQSFDYDRQALTDRLETKPVYGEKFAPYLLYKMDMIVGGTGHKLQPPKQISVEHILPQNPASGSQWRADFSDSDRAKWTHRLGNLVLIGRRKNTSLGNQDYVGKKQVYFAKNIVSFPHTNKVISTNSTWDLPTLSGNHANAVDMLRDYYHK